jgi:hypothetical protein
MTAATENRPPGRISAFLAGLQGGMVGVLCMLAWLGVSATWLRRSFWTSENLIASAFYGDAAIQRGFAGSTVSGTALYVLVYSLLGGLFAVVCRSQARQVRILLLSLAFSTSWYYLSFHVMYRSLLPLVYLLHAERPMVLGHLVYGTFLSRFQNYVGRRRVDLPVPVEE